MNVLHVALRSAAFVALVYVLTSPTMADDKRKSVEWKRPVYEVRRVSGAIKLDGVADEPGWERAASIRVFVFPRWKGKQQPQQCEAKMLWDANYLYVFHKCTDAHIVSKRRKHDDPGLAKDDCFEVMVAPDPKQPDFYFNIEWNVHGSYIDSHRPKGPQGPRAGAWKARGVKVVARVNGTLNDPSDVDRSWTCEVAIPLTIFAAQGHSPTPKVGDRWNLNLNRHNHLPGGVLQLSQWSSSGTPRPAFHAPHRFGQVVFVGRKAARK